MLPPEEVLRGRMAFEVELDDGQEINYKPCMEALAEAGYKGYVGQEFIPTGDPMAALTDAVTLCDV